MKIYYTGIGCNRTGLHTEAEFLEIMRIHFTDKNWKQDFDFDPNRTSSWNKLFKIQQIEFKNNCQLEYKNFDLPNDFEIFTLEDWLEYSGAEIAE